MSKLSVQGSRKRNMVSISDSADENGEIEDETNETSPKKSKRDPDDKSSSTSEVILDSKQAEPEIASLTGNQIMNLMI